MNYVNMPAKDGIERYRAEWQSINADSFLMHPLLDIRFVELLVKYFSTGNERLVGVVDNGKLTSAALVKYKKLGIWESFMPSQAQMAPSLLKDCSDAKKIFNAFKPEPMALDLLGQDPDFTQIVEEDYQDKESMHFNQTINIRIEGSFEDYWNSRSKNLRKNIKRYIRRLESDFSSIELVTTDTGSQILNAVERYSKLEMDGWKGRIGTAVCEENDQLNFYSDLLQSFSKDDHAKVFELKVDGKTIASRLVIDSNSHIVILKTAYDESYSQYSPGKVLLYMVLESLFEIGSGKILEFYTNASQDQKMWATGERSIQHITLYNNPYARLFINMGRTGSNFLKLMHRALPFGNSEVGGKGKVHIADELKSLEDIPSSYWNSEQESFSQGLSWFLHLSDTILDERKKLLVFEWRSSAVKMDKPRVVYPFLAYSRYGVQILESLANYYSPLYGPIYSDRRDIALAAEDIVGYINSNKIKSTLVNIHPLSEDSGEFKALWESFSKRGWWMQKYFCFGNWYLPCKGISFEQYMSERPSKLRNTLKRKKKAFEQKEGVSLKVYLDIDSVKEAASAFNHVYSRSWKKPEPYPDFIEGLMGICAVKGWLRLGVAWINDKPIAAQFWIVSGGTASIYKLAYDEDYRSLSPGTILSSHMMEYVLDKDNVEQVDYLAGDDQYKSQWMTNRRQRVGIVAINKGQLLGFPLMLYHKGGSWLKKYLYEYGVLTK